MYLRALFDTQTNAYCALKLFLLELKNISYLNLDPIILITFCDIKVMWSGTE